MTAAAVVVSAMDNGASQKRTVEPVESKMAPVDIKVDEANTPDKVKTTNEAGQTDNEQKERRSKAPSLGQHQRGICQ